MLFGAWSRAKLPTDAFARMAGGRKALRWSNGRVLLGLDVQPLWLPHPRLDALPTGNGTPLAFLGRIDNRTELLGRYGLPSSTSDDLIVLNAYHERRTDAPGMLLGDWAFALYDEAQDRLLLARDPVGTVPLYFAQHKRALVFASEIKTLLAYPGFESEPDENAVAEITVGAARLTPTQTFFRDVHALPPGETLLVDFSSGAQRRQYWDFRPKNTGIRTVGDAADALRVALQDAVTRRTRTSGPVALQLSGGLDSSAICCLAGDRVIPLSYSATDGSPADERRFIERVDRQTGLQTELVSLTPIEFLQCAERGIERAEGPFLSQTPGPFARLVCAARERGAQVLLNGGFGDQVLFPFPPGHFVTLFRTLRWGALWRQQRAVEAWNVDVEPNVLRRQTMRLLMRSVTPALLLEVRRRLRNPRPGAQLFAQHFRSMLTGFSASLPGLTELPQDARPLYETLRAPYKVRALEATMKQAAGLGVAMAFPFLDRDLLQLLFSLPPGLQYAEGTPRALLRRGLARIVPAEILARREKGDYTEPVRIDITRQTQAMVRAISNGELMRRGVLNAEAWRAQENRWQRANVDLGLDPFYLGDLYGLELWYRRFHSASPGAP